MAQEVEMCEFYGVDMVGAGGFRVYCEKKHKASIKCHSKRPECPDYKPSICFAPDEYKRKRNIVDTLEVE